MLLDQYDHQSIEKPEGNQPIYRITYDECRAMVNAIGDTFHSDVFCIEKEKGKVEGIWERFTSDYVKDTRVLKLRCLHQIPIFRAKGP